MFISLAHAAEPAPSAGFLGFLPLIILVLLFYLLILRPQMKRAKELRTMLESLQKGDEVVTNGGLCGRVTKVGENFITLEVAEKMEVAVQKAAIQTLLPKGSLRKLD